MKCVFVKSINILFLNLKAPYLSHIEVKLRDICDFKTETLKNNTPTNGKRIRMTMTLTDATGTRFKSDSIMLNPVGLIDTVLFFICTMGQTVTKSKSDFLYSYIFVNKNIIYLIIYEI